jgi:hypothetical protein
MYKRLFAAALVAAGVAFAVTTWHANRAAAESHSATGDGATTAMPAIAQVQQTALQIAENDGDPAPTAVTATTGTLGAAAHAIDADSSAPTITDPLTGKPWSETQVYVVAMQGHFTYDGPVPSGARTPTGTSLTLMIDGQSGAVVAQILGTTAPDLHGISPSVISLEG